MTVVGVLLVFLLINFDLRIGIVFLSLLILEWLMYNSKMFKSYPFLTRGESGFNTIIFIMIGFVAYIYGSMALLSSTGVNLTLSTFIQFASQETIPALAGDPYISAFIITVPGPIVETRFFARLMEFTAMMTRIQIKPDIFHLPQWGLFAFISGVFSIFHLTVKLTSEIGMLLTFSFMMVSLWLIAYREQTAEAVGVHILNNSLVVALRKGVIGI